MRTLKRHILVMGFILCTCVNVYAANSGSQSLFPKSLGMTGEIVGKNVNIRNHPDVHADVIEKVSHKPVQVVGKNHEWYKVLTQNGEGWVYNTYVDVQREELIPYAKVKGEELVEYGLQFLGTPYVWGGNNLTGGVDCSGFTQQVFGAFDIDISRVSYMQALDGEEVSKNELRTGDLIFFDTTGINNGQISHVGIYMGDGKFIHSESTRGVTVSNLSSGYYTRNYVKAIRVL